VWGRWYKTAESLAPSACTTIEEVGSTGVGALTITFLILAVSTIIFISRAGSANATKKYYYASIYICTFATMAYFAMLSGQGWTAIAGCRQFFYARYADYVITMPLIILQLGIVAGADGAQIAATIGADVLSIASLYLASVSVVTTVKWFWFVIAACLLVCVVASFARAFKESANLRGPDVASLYGQLAALTMICFIAYPMVWLFSEGFASFSVSFEVCAYAMLDIVSKVIFCFIVMAGNDSLAAAPDAYNDYK